MPYYTKCPWGGSSDSPSDSPNEMGVITLPNTEQLPLPVFIVEVLPNDDRD